MYKYDQYDHAMVQARVEDFRDQTRRRIAGQLMVEIRARIGYSPEHHTLPWSPPEVTASRCAPGRSAGPVLR